ncbi:MAG: Mur ligase family protein, partial [Actinomycetota bacterium]|nr:Mur ligase family protein [Actinomycetota bacterium]
MRRAISWTELVGLRVGVWGARVEGAANLRRLSVLGVPPVAVVDDGVEGVVEGQRVLGAAGGGLDALASCDVVVKSPGISRHSQQVAALEEEGVAVTGGLALWLADHAGEEVVCVTGSKGKSTTTAVAGHLAAGLGRRPFVGGNIGRPPWDPAAPEPPGGADLWIVETSSFQAADVARSPRVVVVTSLSPDHLDWHGDLATYYADKLSLCSQPGAELTVR